MPEEQYMTKTRLSEVLNTQDRTVMDLKQVDTKKLSPEEAQRIKNGESVTAAEREIELIDKILYGEYKIDNLSIEQNEQIKQEDLTEEVIASLRHKKALDQAHLLINNHMYDDSKEMTAVKNDVMNLISFLEQNMDIPMTPELMDNMEVAYSHATASCRYYVENKNPTFKKGKLRKKMVNELLVSLSFEVTAFNCLRQSKDAEGKTFRNLMQLPKAQGEVQARPAMKAQETKVDAKEKQKAADNAAFVKNLFGNGFNILTEIASSKNKADKAAQLKKLHRTLALFAPNQVEVQDVEILGKKVRLVQRSDNTLCVMQGDQEIPLELNAINLSNKIETSIMEDPVNYGDASVKELLDRYEREAPNVGEHTRIRTMLASFLAKKTGLVENEFNNCFKETLVGFARDIIEGKKTGEQIKTEVENANKENLYVNGVALSEMIKLNKNKSVDEIRRHVILQEKQEKEVIPDGWTAEEQQVKNLLAELVFSTDTSKMDESIQNPAKFMQEILSQHKKAVINISTGDPQIVTKVLNKMSLSEFAGEGDNNLAAVMEKSMNTLRSFINTQLDRFKKGGDLEGTKDVNTEEDKLDFILKKNDDSVKEALENVKAGLDKAVEDTCAILQDQATKMTEAIFPENEEEQPIEGRELKEVIDEAMYASKGMGKFVRTTLKKYFNGVSIMDKRAMIASVLRSAESVSDYTGEDPELVQEIKTLKIKKYENNFKTIHNRQYQFELNEEDKKALEEYKAEKLTLKKQANFFGGLLRGAGPLLQKMMQALDRAPLPPEILKAIEDMKSDLPPIPDEVVQTELLSMVQNSGGAVTEIKVERSLGAASVGQTFLCRVKGPKMPEEGKEVVIKLLRPDAKNRMQREEKIMLDCAKETGDAMYRTYLGQMEGFKAELDLSIEGRNCMSGIENYKKGSKFEDVETMRVFDEIPATNTSLVVEKAKGENCARYIKELSNYGDKLLGKYYHKAQYAGVTVVNKRLTMTAENRDELLEAKKQMIDKIDEAVKRRDHLINLSNVWIDQAIMKSGFFHGDLHGGNIMIDDDQATFIDYGNAMKFTDKQKDNVLKMVLAAQGSIKEKVSQNALDLFFEAFDDLLKENNDQEFLKTYTEEKKTELKNMFAKVLKLGTTEEPGRRIYLCILKAQELGIKLPPEVQSFIEGQVRLQNTINSMNSAIKELKECINNIETAHTDNSDTDCVSVVQNKVAKMLKSPKSFFETYITELSTVEKDVFIAEMTDKTYVEEDEEEGIQEVDKRAEFKNKYYEDLSNMRYLTLDEKKKMGIVDYTDDEKKAGAKTYRQKVEAFIAKYDNNPNINKDEYRKDFNELSSDFCPQSSIGNDSLEFIGGYVVLQNKLFSSYDKLNKADLMEFIDIYEKDIPAGLAMYEHMSEFFKNEDQYSDEEKQEKMNQIYSDYTKTQNLKLKNSKFISEVKTKMNSFGAEKRMENDLKLMFAEKQDGLGGVLRTKFDVYKEIRSRIKPHIEKGNEIFVVPDELMEEFKKAESEFLEAYQAVAAVQLRRFHDKSYAKDPSVKFVNFDTVMVDVVKQNISNFFAAMMFLKRLGSLAAKVGMALND